MRIISPLVAALVATLTARSQATKPVVQGTDAPTYPECSHTLLAPFVWPLVARMKTCGTETGFNFAIIGQPALPQQLEALRANQGCVDLLNDLRDASPNCDIFLAPKWFHHADGIAALLGEKDLDLAGTYLDPAYYADLIDPVKANAPLVAGNYVPTNPECTHTLLAAPFADLGHDMKKCGAATGFNFAVVGHVATPQQLYGIQSNPQCVDLVQRMYNATPDCDFLIAPKWFHHKDGLAALLGEKRLDLSGTYVDPAFYSEPNLRS